MGKPRDWNAVDAHFRRGGPMKHKNTPRGGASNETRDLLTQAAAESLPQERCQRACCQESRQRPESYVCRWICACCGNLLREDPQVAPLPSQTLKAVGACCADILPEHLRSKAMPVRDIKKPLPGRYDQRAQPRLDSDPGATLGKEKS